MVVRPRLVYRLLARDLREISFLIGSLVVLFAAALLVGVVKNPLYAGSANSVVLAGAVSTMATFQYVQALILKEKASGTFLLLRSLPVTNNEIALSKVLAVCVGTEIVYLLLIGAVDIFVAMRNIAVMPFKGWVVLWTAGILLLIAITSAGAALAYDQKRAMVVPPFVIGLLVLLVAGVTQLTGPVFWREFVACRAEQWGLLILAIILVVSVRLVLRAFNKRDFVQLAE